MRRREFLMSTAALGAAGLTTSLMTGRAFAEPGVIDIFSNSDANITDFWQSNVRPVFEGANPGVSLNVVPSGGSAGMNAILDRAYAAFKSSTDPQVDMFEATSGSYPKGAGDEGAWVDMTQAGLSNWSSVNTGLMPFKWALPYRGSVVALMYNAEKVKNPPQTYPELVAWIKANPGRFTYPRPDVGDSGEAFMARSLWEANSHDTSLYTADNYTPEYAAPYVEKLWALLNEIGPHLYGNGQYAGGNTQAIQMLASGAIDMTVAWSDMALQAMTEGVVPQTTALAQLQDLSFQGGYVYMVVPNAAANKEAALKLADFMISSEIQNKIVTQLGGFPSVKWSVLDPTLEAKYNGMIPAKLPRFPAQWWPPLYEGWYRNVGTGLTQG